MGIVMIDFATVIVAAVAVVAVVAVAFVASHQPVQKQKALQSIQVRSKNFFCLLLLLLMWLLLLLFCYHICTSYNTLSL